MSGVLAGPLKRPRGDTRDPFDPPGAVWYPFRGLTPPDRRGVFRTPANPSSSERE